MHGIIADVGFVDLHVIAVSGSLALWVEMWYTNDIE
jgi:hypothetical protein